MNVIDINLYVAPTDCWSCGAEFEIVSLIKLTRGQDSAECEVSDFTDYPDLAAELSSRLSALPAIGELKLRHSATIGNGYVSNGCAHCDAIFGRHFEIGTRYNDRLAVSFEADAAYGWGDMLDRLLASDDGHLFH
jgi:hypothetical protein